MQAELLLNFLRQQPQLTLINQAGQDLLRQDADELKVINQMIILEAVDYNQLRLSLNGLPYTLKIETKLDNADCLEQLLADWLPTLTGLTDFGFYAEATLQLMDLPPNITILRLNSLFWQGLPVANLLEVDQIQELVVDQLYLHQIEDLKQFDAWPALSRLQVTKVVKVGDYETFAALIHYLYEQNIIQRFNHVTQINSDEIILTKFAGRN